MTSVPLVGMYHHKPAIAVLSVLPSGTPLQLQPDPSNPYDPNAIEVWISWTSIPPTSHGELSRQLPGFGFEFDEIAGTDIMLGFVAAKETHQVHPILAMAATNEASGEAWPYKSTLGFDFKGKPLVILTAGE